MIEFPLLTAEQISVKVKQVTAKGAVALLYKSARVDMDMLDAVVGQDKWTCDYKEIKGNLFCGIGIDLGKPDFLWKWDCGVESGQTDGNEKKAEASDAFKRAGFRWGIGRELYTAPFTFLRVETKQVGSKWELADKFARYAVGEIDYADRKITRLSIINPDSGAVVFSYGSKNNASKKPLAQKEEMPMATPEQIKMLQSLFTPERYRKMLEYYGVENAGQFTKEQADSLIKAAQKETAGGKQDG